MAEGLPKTAEMVHHMADDMARGHKSAQGIELSFFKLTALLTSSHIVEGVFERFVKKSEIWAVAERALSKEQLDRNRLLTRYNTAFSDAASMTKTVRDEHRTMSKIELSRLDTLRKEMGLIRSQRELARELSNYGRVRLTVLGLAVSATSALYGKQRQFNQDLIEANASYTHRNQLLKDTLMLQAQSGISFERATSAARALVHYGMDTEASFAANLEIVSKMEQGLGVSVNESARLASVVERQVKGSFEGVAKTIAQIVDDTALAGDEAARLSLNISTALGRLRPGLGAAGLPEVLRLVGRYEGALKEIGGQSGALTQLLTQLTTPEGIVGAGALGVNPEFLATANGVENVITRFGKYGEMLVGQSQGWERQMRLQALAQQFSISADQANQLMLMVKRANEQQMGQISLQDRWKEQLNATNSGISRLTNSLWGLVQRGMLPVVNAVGFLVNKLADFVEWTLKSKTVVSALGVGLALTSAAAALSLWKVVRSLTAVVISSTAAQAAINRYSVAQGLSAAGGAAGGATGLIGLGTRILSGLRFFVATPLGALLGVAIGAGVILHKIYGINKASADAQRQAQQIILSSSQALEARRKAQLYSASRFGEASDVMAVYKKLAGDATMLFQGIVDPAERRAKTADWLSRMAVESQLDVMKGVTTRGMFQPLEERTPEEKKREDEMRDLTEKMLKVNVEQRVLAERDIQAKLQQQQENEVIEAKNRVWYMRGGANNPIAVWSNQLTGQ